MSSIHKYFKEGETAIRKDNLEDYRINYSDYIVNQYVTFKTDTGENAFGIMYTGWVYSQDGDTGLFQEQLMKKHTAADISFQIELKNFLQ